MTAGSEIVQPDCRDYATDGTKRGWLSRGLHLAGWFLGLCSLYFFFRYFFEWATFQQSLRQADWPLLVLGMGVYVLGILMRSIRWTFMVRCRQPNLTWVQGLHAMLASNLINFIFPVRLGELLKLVIVRQISDVSYSASTAASIIEKLTLFLIMIFCLSFTPFVGYRFPDWSARFFPFLLLLILVSLAVFFFGVKGLHACKTLAGTLLNRIGFARERVDAMLNNRLSRFAEDTLRQCHVSAYTGKQFWVAFVLGLVVLALDGLANLCLLSAFGLKLTYIQAVVAACFFNLLFLLPSPPGQVGTAEMYPVLIYAGGLKLSAAVVASASIVWHVITAGILFLMGLWSLYAIGIKMSSLIAMSRRTPKETL